MQIQNVSRRLLWALFVLLRTMSLVSVASSTMAQSPDQPWMNSNLSPEERAEMVLKQMTLEEKIALLHGNGMAHASQWQMPLTHLANGGAGYVEGVERLGIPPIFISDAAYGFATAERMAATRRHFHPLLRPLRVGIRRAPASTARSSVASCERRGSI
jgi:hypothetical protein